MQRKRLKSSSGCDYCRARRKKCDETKPACKNCTRLGRRCSYLDLTPDQPPIHRLDVLDIPVVTKEFISSVSDPGPTIVPRIADHSVWWQTVTRDEDDVVRLFNSDTPHGLASAVSNLESVIISGVWQGWASLLSKSDIPQRVVDLDKSLRSAGHGIIARIIFMYYNCLLDDYISSRAQSSLSSYLPTWTIARPAILTGGDDNCETIDTFDTLTPEQMISMYMPWPVARARVQHEPTRYCNDHFFRQLWRSTRFVWPFAMTDAIHANVQDGTFSFSAELLLRAKNIRSFPVTKDFLDTYTEFRGEVPQFEPSPTWYRPEEQRRWEAVFWAKLRERQITSRKRHTSANMSRSTRALSLEARP